MRMHDHAVLAASGEWKWGRAAVSLLRKLMLLLCIVLVDLCLYVCNGACCKYVPCGVAVGVA